MVVLNFGMILLSSLIAMALGPAGAWLAGKTGLVDVPGSAPHKTHPAATPLAGGIVLLSTVFLMALAASPSGNEVWSILLPSLAVFGFGLIDDYRGLSAPWKLTGQLLGALGLIVSGIYVRLFDQAWLNYGLTIFWVVGITNAYNFVDSMDGLAAGLATLAAAFFMLVASDSGQQSLSILSAILLGACGVVYYYTALPAKFFLGDSGAQLLGFMLAGIGIAYTPQGFLRIQSWFIPILLVGVPIFDTTLVVFSRLRRGKPIYRSSRDHTYHRLVEQGLHPNRAVLTMHLLAVLLGCLAFITLSLSPLLANAIFFTCLTAGILALVYLDNRKRWP